MLTTFQILTASCLLMAEANPPSTVPVELNGHPFVLPDGFTIELAASGDLAPRPITADFDEEGRLYVGDSSGANDKVQKQLEDKPHRILRLEDSDSDGKFDTQTVFADKMMFPEGTLWHDGSLYVAAPPSIWKLTDANGDGVADQRTEWFAGKTLTGCANDLHGPYLGLDGWIYWCKGAFAEQRYVLPTGKELVTRAAHIFRCRPDGTGIEPVMTGGMDNPVEVAFSPGGERFFTTTFLQTGMPGLRDGVIHAIYGGVYGKVNAAADGHPRTGELMPPLIHLGPAVPSGILCYASNAFGGDCQGNLFVTQFNLQKVSRHVLVPSGGSFTTKDHDFLISQNRDFHPTDVLEDADGSMLVVDTGGWYKLCCPSSQIGKADVLGAIYRIRRKDAPKIADPRGRTIAWNEQKPAQLAKLLGDPRPAVRQRATAMLGRGGTAAVAAIVLEARSAADAGQRLQSVWALTRIDGPEARSAVREFLKDSDETVRHAAIHSISVRRDQDATAAIVELLHGQSLANRRAAAEALGRIGTAANVSPLLIASSQPNDRALEHSLAYALIEIGNPKAVKPYLASTNPFMRRTALLVLDQTPNSGLTPEQVVPLLDSTTPMLRETALWIVQRRPEWGESMVEFIKRRLTTTGVGESADNDVEPLLARFAAHPSIQVLMGESLHDSVLAPPARQVVLRAMAQSGLKEAPAAWVQPLSAVLRSSDPNLVGDALTAAKTFAGAKKESPELRAALLELGQNERLPSEIRLTALSALGQRMTSVDPKIFALLIANLDSAEPASQRSSAVDVLVKSKLDAEQLNSLAQAARTTGPLELERLLPMFTHPSAKNAGVALVAALSESPALANLRVDSLKPHLLKLDPSVQPKVQQFLARLDAIFEQQRTRLDELMPQLIHGDVRRGQAVFNGTKAACAGCHTMGYLGGKTGPDLTRVGQIRTERDLLEAIVYPSASFVRSYEPIVVATSSGAIHTGVLRKESADEVVLATSPKDEVRVPRSDIDEMRLGNVSIMPAGFDRQLTVQELADLVAFLKNAR